MTIRNPSIGWGGVIVISCVVALVWNELDYFLLHSVLGVFVCVLLNGAWLYLYARSRSRHTPD